MPISRAIEHADGAPDAVLGAGRQQQSGGGRGGEPQHPAAVLAGEQPRRGVAQPQRGRVDVAGDERQLPGAAHQYGRRLAGEVHHVEQQQPDGQRRLLVQRVDSLDPQQPDHDEHVAEQLAHRDVEADLAQQRQQTGLLCCRKRSRARPHAEAAMKSGTFGSTAPTSCVVKNTTIASSAVSCTTRRGAIPAEGTG